LNLAYVLRMKSSSFSCDITRSIPQESEGRLPGKPDEPGTRDRGGDEDQDSQDQAQHFGPRSIPQAQVSA
jgi:hypothetical protein